MVTCTGQQTMVLAEHCIMEAQVTFTYEINVCHSEFMHLP